MSFDKRMLCLLLGHRAQPDSALLNSAVLRRDLEYAQMMLEAGASSTVPAGAKSLLYQAVTDNNCSMVELLLEHRADPNCDGGRPLFKAIQRGMHDIAETLLANGADANGTAGTTQVPLC